MIYAILGFIVVCIFALYENRNDNKDYRNNQHRKKDLGLLYDNIIDSDSGGN